MDRISLEDGQNCEQNAASIYVTTSITKLQFDKANRRYYGQGSVLIPKKLKTMKSKQIDSKFTVY